MKVGAYVPFFNNEKTLAAALQSIDSQTYPIERRVAIDDGSTDGSAQVVKPCGWQLLQNGSNLGRGATRSRAMETVDTELVLCCDATNSLPTDFVRNAVQWFQDPDVVAVFGRLTQRDQGCAASRWRGRHLFKQDQALEVAQRASLITYGTLVRRSAVLEVGNFNPALRHTEDAELGERLLKRGYKVVFDPALRITSNSENTVAEVLERYWRWHCGTDEKVSISSYFSLMAYAAKVMAVQDCLARDPGCALLSLYAPHYQFWRSAIRGYFR